MGNNYSSNNYRSRGATNSRGDGGNARGGGDKPKLQCYRCGKQNHMAKNCRSTNLLSTNGDKNQGNYKQKTNNDFYKGNYSGTVGLILQPNVFENHVSVGPVEVIESESHPLYWPHMVYGSLVNYDDESSELSISILRDTGALMSIINADLISDRNAIQTGEFRLIQGSTGATQKLPLVEISIKSKIATGKFLYCSSTQLPAGVDLIWK